MCGDSYICQKSTNRCMNKIEVECSSNSGDVVINSKMSVIKISKKFTNIKHYK